MLGLARVVVILGGLLLIGFGVWLATAGSEGDFGLVLVGLLTAVIGVACIAALTVERIRYRSDAAETPAWGGPPGGETPGASLEARFRPTSEVFIDPSSGRTMRVFSDPDTGERRYLAEG